MENPESTQIACQKCGKSFPNKKCLKQHHNKKIPCDLVHRCLKCSKTFKTKRGLTRHMNRKTPCEPLLNNKPPVIERSEPKCKFCGRTYSNIYSLRRHIRNNCRIKNGGMDLLYAAVVKENEELKEKVKNPPAAVVEADNSTNNSNNSMNNSNNSNNSNNTINNTITNNINITNNITMTDFSDPNVSYVSPVLTAQMFNENVVEAPVRIVRYVWFNSEHPENHTVYLVNKKTRETLVYSNKKWTYMDFDMACAEMRGRACGFMPLSDLNILKRSVAEQAERMWADEEQEKKDSKKILRIMVDGRRMVENTKMLISSAHPSLLGS